MLQVALAILGTYYWSFIVTKLAGPWTIFRKLRARFKSDLVSCPHCLGAHLALTAAAWLCWFGEYQLWEFPLLVFGIAGGSSMIHLFDKSG